LLVIGDRVRGLGSLLCRRLSRDGGDDAPDREADPGADGADHHHLKPGPQQGEAGDATLCDSHREQRDQGTDEAHREREM